MDITQPLDRKQWISLAIETVTDFQKNFFQNLNSTQNPRFYAYQILKELIIEQLPQEDLSYEKNSRHPTR